MQDRKRKRPCPKSEYSNSAIKRNRIDPRFTSLLPGNQYNISKPASNIQIASEVNHRAISNLSYPSQTSGDNLSLLTQQSEQTLQTFLTTFGNSALEQNIQSSVEGCEKVTRNDFSLISNMYGPSFCLPDKCFGLSLSSSQWADGFASLVPFRPASTNQPNLSMCLSPTKIVDANFLADGNLYSSEKSQNGASISEKPFIPTSGTNPYASERYFDDPQTHMHRLEEQVSRFILEFNLTEC